MNLYQKQHEALLELTKQSFSKPITIEVEEEVCKHCENTGIMYVQNGEDDVDAETCNCIYGQLKMK